MNQSNYDAIRKFRVRCETSRSDSDRLNVTADPKLLLERLTVHILELAVFVSVKEKKKQNCTRNT